MQPACHSAYKIMVISFVEFQELMHPTVLLGILYLIIHLVCILVPDWSESTGYYKLLFYICTY